MKQVYFVLAAEVARIKIGCSIHPASRLAILQGWTPYRLELLAAANGAERQENWLHHRFADAHLFGEWFTATDALRACAGAVAQAGGFPSEWQCPADWRFAAQDGRGANISASLKQSWAKRSPESRASFGRAVARGHALRKAQLSGAA